MNPTCIYFVGQKVINFKYTESKNTVIRLNYNVNMFIFRM